MKKIKGGENDIRLWGGVVLAFEFKNGGMVGGGGLCYFLLYLIEFDWN